MSRCMKARPGTACHDCGKETLSPRGASEYYMVHNHVWQAASAPARGFLCIGCLEARLGRQLHRGDFAPVPLNDLNYHRPDKAWWHRTKRLRDRLRAPSPEDGTQLALWPIA
jgi:hypothetical protein